MSHDSGGISAETIFEEQWAIYRKVVDHDYMGHKIIGEALKKSFTGEQVGDLLDLGCGDAEISSLIAANITCRSFTGVDLSQAALGFARKRITEATEGNLRADFVRHELLDFVQQASEASFDTVLAGFSVHHLSQEEKRQFFFSVLNILKPAGNFFFYDVFLLNDLDRDRSVGRYLEWIKSDWAEMTKREHELIREHIWASDFPESISWIEGLVDEAGFESRIQVVDCCQGYHLGYLITLGSQ